MNIETKPGFPIPEVTAWERGDACDLRFADLSFDIAFSHSVIEHVVDQAALAGELRRVRRRYYVQTPNFLFPVETHVYGVGVHWVYQTFNRWHFPLMSLWFCGRFARGVSATRCAELASEIRLVTSGAMKRLFPDGRIVREWSALRPFPKSLIAQR